MDVIESVNLIEGGGCSIDMENRTKWYVPSLGSIFFEMLASVLKLDLIWG
jgi:hypothetical protein